MRLMETDAPYKHSESLEFGSNGLELYCYWDSEARITRMSWKGHYGSIVDTGSFGYLYPFLTEKLDIR